jgi:hypothetical protein
VTWTRESRVKSRERICSAVMNTVDVVAPKSTADLQACVSSQGSSVVCGLPLHVQQMCHCCSQHCRSADDPCTPTQYNTTPLLGANTNFIVLISYYTCALRNRVHMQNRPEDTPSPL